MTASEPITNSVAYQTPIRSPYTGSRASRSGADDIAHAPDGVQQLLLETAIDLLAQAADEDVHDVGLRVEAVVPHVRQNHRLRNDLAGVAHQVLEQRELAWTQIDDRLSTCHAA